MAVCSSITCDTCHKDKEVWHGSGEPKPKTCAECLKGKASAKKQAHLDALTKLPTEERLRMIEEYIYDHKLLYHPGKQLLF